jgi:carboxypeptidase C (cathepsin A)
MTDPSTLPSPRPGSTTEHTLKTSQGTLSYTASAQWQLIYENEKPVAELFHVAYQLSDRPSSDRPLTFVFNGGPGAASAYLHMGALGPQRVYFHGDGSLPKPPVRVVDNPETWLSFTDLVFIDPVGTGFSRRLPHPEERPQENTTDPSPEKGTESKSEKKFWEVEQDLNTLGQFIQNYLSSHHR